ncbi:MAG: single-stranded-DNA-specific exonuclease RecJ [Candidatus Eisenbacteria bacterium]|nr:single-stranded-DNA-specific exonuclease RecJ [Candidatus Eisenbacteria bacterium]
MTRSPERAAASPPRLSEVAQSRTKWRLPDGGVSESARALAAEMGVPTAFASVLVTHGIATEAEARAFLSPDRATLCDPEDLPDLEPALARLREAIDRRGRVFVCGDYDVDGITSVVLVKRCLESAGASVGYYIPNRLIEGYGLSEGGVLAARDFGADLIVTVDSGVTGHDEIGMARSLGIDSIVIDHHEPQDDLPPALAVVDPKRKDSRYPFKDLAGVGVAFKVMEALARDYRDVAYTVEESLDLVAIGTVADIVPLVSENRVLTTLGLERLRVTSNAGLRALMDVAGVESLGARASHIGFALGPRLNAAGRLGDARIGVELLTTDDSAKAAAMAKQLDLENRRRRELECRVLDQATRMIDESSLLDSRLSIVLWSSEWHPGVIGIVASRIAKLHNRPTILLSVADGACKGSGRSIPGFDLHAALAECRHCLDSFGGHRHAAGVSLAEGRLDEFSSCIEAAVSRSLTPADLVPVVDVDAIVSLDECDFELVRLMAGMRPFGVGNPEPVLGATGVKLVSARSVGNGHLKMTVAQGDRVMDAIGFGMADALADLRAGGGTVSLAFVLEENTWRGVTGLQLRLRDVQTGPG